MRGATPALVAMWAFSTVLSLASATLAQPSVVLQSPEPGQPVFGEVEVVADVMSEQALRRVTFWLDGEVVGELSRPPYRLVVEVKETQREHRFEVVAEDVSGGVGRSLLVSQRLDIDLELELGLQQLYVTVSGRDQRVLGLTAEDFVVLDNGKPQELVTFERGDVPLTALLLLDASDSMRGDRLAAAVAGASTFIAGMQELDQAKLLLFADRVIHNSPFTSFAEVLATGLGAVEADGSTALNDHLYLALKLLEPRQGRRVIILLSDGIDVSSVLRMQEVMPALKHSQALIYWLRLGSARPMVGQTSAWRDAPGHRQEFELLKRGVEESGGRILVLSDITQTAAAFSEILGELRDQYVLGYYPSDDTGAGDWHEVRVRVRDRRQDVRTRQGYVDF